MDTVFPTTRKTVESYSYENLPYETRFFNGQKPVFVVTLNGRQNGENCFTSIAIAAANDDIPSDGCDDNEFRVFGRKRWALHALP